MPDRTPDWRPPLLPREDRRFAVTLLTLATLAGGFALHVVSSAGAQRLVAASAPGRIALLLQVLEADTRPSTRPRPVALPRRPDPEPVTPPAEPLRRQAALLATPTTEPLAAWSTPAPTGDELVAMLRVHRGVGALETARSAPLLDPTPRVGRIAGGTDGSFELELSGAGSVPLGAAPALTGPEPPGPGTAAPETGPLGAAHRAQLGHCYVRVLKREPDLAGRLVVRWEVDGGGAQSVDVIEDGTGSEALVSCVRARLMRWRFAEDGTFTETLAFRPRD